MRVKNPSLGWEKLKDVFYRNRELCQLRLPADEEYKLVLSTTVLAVETENNIQIFQYHGKLLNTVELRKLPSELICYELDSQDEGSLTLAMSDRIRVYSSLTPLQFQDYLLPDSLQDTIWDYKNRILVLSSSQDLYHFTGDNLVKICTNDERFTLLTKEHWHCNNDTVILLDVNGVLHLDIASGLLNAEFKNEVWHSVRVSPKGFIGLLNRKTNELRVYKNADIKLMEITLDTHPSEIAWCGDDTIACSFNNEEIKLYGPNSDYVTFWYPEEVVGLRTEPDGLKVVTNDKVNFISKVQQQTANIFLMGSTEASSILLDSVNLLSSQAPRAVENLKIINLDQGVAECLEAALEELEPYWQKKLLSAAAFGKSSLTNQSSSNEFVRTCDTLRVLNTLTEKGIVITAKQFLDIGLDAILLRLMKTGDFYECTQICSLLKERGKIPAIFEAWANAKISLSSDLDDESLFQIITKLADRQPVNVPMAEIGLAAFAEGRVNLARSLVVKETLPEVELSCLLELDEYELALKEGKRLGLPEMTTSLLLSLRDRLSNAQFTKIITLVMQDNQLYSYYSRHNKEFLFDFYRQADCLGDLAQHIWKQGVQEGNTAEYIHQVEELYSRITHDPLIKQDQPLLQRQSQLYEFQKSITPLLQRDITNLSMDDTIEQLVISHLDKQLNALLKKFKISEQKLYYIKCRVLAQEGRFEDLYKFAQERKSPIGYLPFYRYCLKHNRKDEAIPYVRLLSGIPPATRVEMYLKCGSYHDAIKFASKEKDISLLKHIYKAVPANEPEMRTLASEAISRI